MRTTHGLVMAALSTLAAGRLWSQNAQGSVSISGGSATNVLGETSRALTIAPSLTLTPDPRATVVLDGSGTRFDGQQWSVEAGAAAALRAPLSRFAAATLNVAASSSTSSYDFSYLSAGVIPGIE